MLSLHPSVGETPPYHAPRIVSWDRASPTWDCLGPTTRAVDRRNQLREPAYGLGPFLA